MRTTGVGMLAAAVLVAGCSSGSGPSGPEAPTADGGEVEVLAEVLEREADPPAEDDPTPEPDAQADAGPGPALDAEDEVEPEPEGEPSAVGGADDADPEVAAEAPAPSHPEPDASSGGGSTPATDDAPAQAPTPRPGGDGDPAPPPAAHELEDTEVASSGVLQSDGTDWTETSSAVIERDASPQPFTVHLQAESAGDDQRVSCQVRLVAPADRALTLRGSVELAVVTEDADGVHRQLRTRVEVDITVAAGEGFDLPASRPLTVAHGDGEQRTTCAATFRR